jgi:RNA polymerase sigma-70 factor (ECF subfamily)
LEEVPPTDQLNEDAALLGRLRAGEPAAFEEVVRAESGKLLAVTRRILPIEEDARDAVQDAFLFAFRSLDRFQGQAKLSTWLHRIAVNAALMKLRTRRRKREESLEPLLPTFKDDGHHAERFAAWDDPAVTIEREENKALVRRLINELPDAYRTVLLLRDIEGLDTEETAKLLETTANAVKVRLHRARQALRTLLAPHFTRSRR